MLILVFLDEWKNEVFDDVKSKVHKLNKVYRRHTKSILTNPIIKNHLEELHENYVVVHTDKAKNNIAIVCKKFYIEKSMQELKIFKDSINVKNDDNTYVQLIKTKHLLSMSIKSI
jgi:hypothetical protein